MADDATVSTESGSVPGEEKPAIAPKEEAAAAAPPKEKEEAPPAKEEAAPKEKEEAAPAKEEAVAAKDAPASAPSAKEKSVKEKPAKEKPAPARPAAPAAKLVPSEIEINSPDRKTLAALLVVFAVTTVSWGAARFACNMHPPESRAAPKLSTDRLLLTAKDAAIEFVQRWRSLDYDGAIETAEVGDLVSELQKAKAECAAKANDCAREREASAGRLTTATVVAQDGFFADTRVTTTLKGVKETYRVRVRREGNLWKAVSKSTETS
jgi:hypothetical protein